MQRIAGSLEDDALAKAISSLNLEPSESKAAFAAVHFMIASAVKYGVDGSVLATELQQLGLPKGANVMCSFCCPYCFSQSTVRHACVFIKKNKPQRLRL